MNAMGHLEPDVLAETWIDYKETGDIAHRNQLVLHYASLVKYVASKIAAGLPAEVDRDDLVSYGMFGLIDALEKFSLDKGVKFETYGVARIRGAIYDEIRALDWVPRSARSKARDIDKARTEVEMTLGRPAEHAEVAQNLSLSMEEYWRLSSQAAITQVDSTDRGFSVSASDGEESGHYETHFDPSSNPEDLLEANEIVEIIGEAINNMDERSKTILVLYYLQEMTLAQIGQILGVTESRVCQLQSKVLLALRDSLGQGGLAAA